MALLEVGPSKSAIQEANKAILDILKCGQEQKTIQIALKAFIKSVSVNNTTISGCTFYGNEKD